MPEQPDDWFQRRTDEELRDVRRLLGEVTPRREIDFRFQGVKEQLDALKNSIDTIGTKVDTIADKIGRNALPAWLVSALVSATILVISYFVPHTR